MTKAQDSYDNRPWVKPAVMPPGHYDLDDCGGVHDISHISTPADMRAAREAFEQARRPRGRARTKGETETGAVPGR